MGHCGIMWGQEIEICRGRGCMAMLKEFIGNMAHTIDQKGRVTIPAMYRDTLGEIFYIGMNTKF